MAMPSLNKNPATDHLAWVRWALLALIILTGFVTIGGPLALLIYVLPTVFVLMHGSRYVGRKNIVLFLVVICVVTYTTEYLGVHTGKIFGDYYYNAVGNGPLLGGVPPLLMLTYFSIGYGSYWMVRILTDQLGLIRGWKIAGIGVLGGLIMTLTDLASDPVNSTVNQVYIWTRGGIFFGVPYLNFVGWFGEALVFFVVISLIYGYVSKAPQLKRLPSHRFQLEPVVLFAAPVLPVIVRPVWLTSSASIREAMSLIALFGLGSLVIAAVLKIWWSQRTTKSSSGHI